MIATFGPTALRIARITARSSAAVEYPIFAFHAGKLAPAPIRCDLRRIHRAVVSDRAVSRHWPRNTNQQTQQRYAMQSGHRIPQRHFDAGERHPDQTLRPQRRRRRDSFCSIAGGASTS